nr:immunoglobulin heavy chain junction region [Mus musculus]MBK4185170.1 immunoglobulin heavy chain junction region [Mus musculus]MBK4185171.1 immunoglobulin heavy chain junction region [Mus musculus]MBK4185172.1 immunoglobulin heavy chain junction region [Mus musculus]MBK4185177.1 immunoglobulin heavy chain junction region [Mus musculus]
CARRGWDGAGYYFDYW